MWELPAPTVTQTPANMLPNKQPQHRPGSVHSRAQLHPAQQQQQYQSQQPGGVPWPMPPLENVQNVRHPSNNGHQNHNNTYPSQNGHRHWFVDEFLCHLYHFRQLEKYVRFSFFVFFFLVSSSHCSYAEVQLGTKHMTPPGGATSKRPDCLVLTGGAAWGCHVFGPQLNNCNFSGLMKFFCYDVILFVLLNASLQIYSHDFSSTIAFDAYCWPVYSLYAWLLLFLVSFCFGRNRKKFRFLGVLYTLVSYASSAEFLERDAGKKLE